jgi:GWxTD domain-containing protein
MMKALIFFCMIIFSGMVFAQAEHYSRKPESKVKYYQDFISFKGENQKTRLDYFIQVPYPSVQFLKTGQGFEASYSVSVAVYDEARKNLITEKVWNEKITAISFELTTSPDNFNLGHRSFELTPGIYSIKTSLLDKDSKNEYSSESKVVVKQFNPELSVSEVMLIARRTVTEGSSRIIPNVSGNIITDRDVISTFLEIYSGSDTEVFVDYEVVDEKGLSLHKATKEVGVRQGSNQVFNNLDTLNLDLGKNFLKVTLRDSGGKVSDSTVKPFVSRWFGVPSTLTDLDKAIDQLIYIASPEDLGTMKSAENRQQKAKRFVAFWKKQDPNPADEYNPVFNEYYNRIAYANENFTTYSLEGWRSDRGMVFIILGAPDNIDRHPFEYYAKPYEWWQYYNLNRNFLFVDNTGFGDYRLDPSTPLYGDLYRFRY